VRESLIAAMDPPELGRPRGRWGDELADLAPALPEELVERISRDLTAGAAQLDAGLATPRSRGARMDFNALSIRDDVTLGGAALPAPLDELPGQHRPGVWWIGGTAQGLLPPAGCWSTSRNEIAWQ